MELPSYKMSTIARLSGFSPAVLRAWERRYGLLEPLRTPGGHRMYTAQDLALLERVKVLLDGGRSIGEVASLGREQLLQEPQHGAIEPIAPLPLDPGASPRVELAVQATLDLDATELERLLDSAFAVLSPDAAISTVIEPMLQQIGELWHQGRCSVAVEHMATASVARRLLGLLRTTRATHPRAPTALCASFPEEQHQLGALVVGYYLARRGYQVTHLGPALPLEDLRAAVQALQPSEVFLSVTREALLARYAPPLARLARELDTVQLTVGGQGVQRDHPDLREAGVRLVPPCSFLELIAQGLERLAITP